MHLRVTHSVMLGLLLLSVRLLMDGHGPVLAVVIPCHVVLRRISMSIVFYFFGSWACDDIEPYT